MTTIREALQRAGLLVSQPVPSETWDCLKPRFAAVQIANHKRCGRCHAVKPFDAFHVQSHTSTGRHTVCRSCRSEMRLQRKAAA